MRIKNAFLIFFSVFIWNSGYSQTVVKMDLPRQADQVLKVVALFDEELPEGIPVVLGLMGYDVEGGISPYLFKWLLNGEVISTSDIAVFTPRKGDDLVLEVTDNNHCRASTAFNLKAVRAMQNPGEGEDNIKIYPTVFTREIFIEFPGAGQKEADVRVFTMEGRIVYQAKLQENACLSLDLIPGPYFISVKSRELHKVEKVIAQ